jgi:uncharacterized tellurite resistance protein B-like protein
MIDLIKKFFDKKPVDGRRGKNREGLHDVRVAACALFLEMANIDGEFSEQEKENIVAILKRDYGLAGEHADALLEAAHEELKGSIDLWRFARLVNQNYSQEEKISIIEILWQIIYTDGRLDKHEDYLVHKIAKLLRLTHKQLIDSKLKIIQSDLN